MDFDGDSGSSFDADDDVFLTPHAGRHGSGLGLLGTAVMLAWFVGGLYWFSWLGPDPREAAFHALDEVRLLLLDAADDPAVTAAERAARAGYAIREMQRVSAALVRRRITSPRAVGEAAAVAVPECAIHPCCAPAAGAGRRVR